MEEIFSFNKICKYCCENLRICIDEGLDCSICLNSVHVRCLKRGSVPGGINGDLFYVFTCFECSPSQSELFGRVKLSWLQVMILVVYHLQTRSPGLARKGFFHWRNHMATFIEKNWDILFPKDLCNKKKNKWTGTVAGTLSHFSSYIFLSGTIVFQEQAWWTLKYPKLTPTITSDVYNIFLVEKQKAKLNNNQKTDSQLFHEVLTLYIHNEELLQTFNINNLINNPEHKEEYLDFAEIKKGPGKFIKGNAKKRKSVIPSLQMQGNSKRLTKAQTSSFFPHNLSSESTETETRKSEQETKKSTFCKPKRPDRLLDPMCHYNTSLNKISRMKGETMQIKLMGGIRKELILSPYSGMYLKPYIRRDTETYPNWLRLMTEIQLKSNNDNKDNVLPTRAPIDYTYVQPEHIPAINSLCNQFFWTGIDLTESLQYPDFSCVVLYKKLIVGFAFLVPDVKFTENYISFVFTRPAWRNCGIATFMVYHLIQTSLGKDITLHVSINSPALFLYQKFGFKVEHVVLDFYDKYYRNDVKESKHAFFCRLER